MKKWEELTYIEQAKYFRHVDYLISRKYIDKDSNPVEIAKQIYYTDQKKDA